MDRFSVMPRTCDQLGALRFFLYAFALLLHRKRLSCELESPLPIVPEPEIDMNPWMRNVIG